ncbi:MAG: FISUMP domain-containing protein [Chitinophagales bacterium]
MKKTFLFTLLMALLIVSCKKDDTTPDNIHLHQDLAIYNNVIVIDSTYLMLNQTETNLNSGLYVFDIVDSFQIIQKDNIIVGTENEGYIRKVTTATYNGNQVVLQTSQATMEDVFKQGDFDFNVSFENLEPGTTPDSFAYSVNNYNLQESESLDIQLEYANVSMNSNWLFDFSYNNGALDYFEFSTSNASFNSDARVSLTASQQANLSNSIDTLTTQSKKVIHWLDVEGVLVPVVIKMDLHWLVEYSANIPTNVSTVMESNINGHFNLGVHYQDALWTGSYDFSPNTTVNLEAPSGQANADFNIALRPLLKVKLYGISGPRASLTLMERLEGNVASSSLDWDMKAEAWGKAMAGAEATILGTTLTDCPDKDWSTPKLSHQIPFKLINVSGSEQIGQANTPLQEPIKLQVLDSKDEPVSNVPVYFNVAIGSGSTNPTEILTDDNGYVETLWTLGNPQTTTMQYMDASAKWGDGTALNDTPVKLTATISNACGGQTSFTDPRDGQTYNIVQIGNQCWFAENLRYSGSIPEVSGASNWEAIPNTPAWCYYEDDAANNAIYGKLYNWYAVNSGSICPSGWHIATDTEWTILTDYLGGSNIGGGKMKSTTGWEEPNNDATNSSGFSGLPGGDRYFSGSFYGGGSYGCWWTATESFIEDAWSRGLISSNGSVNRTFYTKTKGLSCRCVRD